LDTTQVDGLFTVNGNSDLNGTLDVQNNATFQDFVTMNDSLNVKMYADFDAAINVDGAAHITGNTDVDGTFDVDGNTTLDTTQVDGLFTVNGNSDLNGTLDVQNNATFQDYVTMNDSLNVKMYADFDAAINVDGAAHITGNTDVDGTFDVDGNTTLDTTQVDGLFTVNGNSDLNGTLDVQNNATFQDYVTMNDSLNVKLHADFDATLNVDGNATFNDFATFNDSVLIQKHLRINTDPSITGVTAMAEAELEVRNLAGARIFQVDGHNSMTTVQDLTVQQSFTANGDITAGGDLIGDDVRASGYVTTGSSVFGNHWPAGTTDWNVVTRKDYVDYHRAAQTDVPTAFSYDASLAGIDTTGNANNAVYYLNGNVVLYDDSTSTNPSGDNYTITVKGANFKNLLTAIGGSTDVSAQLWLENNSLDLLAGAAPSAHNFVVVDDNTITFTIGYSDIDGLTDCTSGIVRPTLALGTATGGFHMTGLHFFFDIVQ
jgi:hypothetical protein